MSNIYLLTELYRLYFLTVLYNIYLLAKLSYIFILTEFSNIHLLNELSNNTLTSKYLAFSLNMYALLCPGIFYFSSLFQEPSVLQLCLVSVTIWLRLYLNLSLSDSITTRLYHYLTLSLSIWLFHYLTLSLSDSVTI